MSTKKYISLDKLSLYDEKIKKIITDGDAASLASAKQYFDDNADNFDAAGSAATAEANAKAYADGKDAAIAEAKKAGTDAAAAAAAADGKAVAAQGEIDALETYVGTFTHDTAKTVVDYINAKTDGIATSGNLEALGTRVTAVEGKVATIEGDYLKAADKTELQGNIDTVSAAVERLTNGVSADEVDGVNDLIQYVKDHGTEVTGMQEDISDNAAAIAGVAGRMDTAEGKITAIEGAVATKAEQTALDEAVEALEGADEALSGRIATLEGKFGGAEGSVEAQIAAAKQEAIDTAAGDATTKANTAETNAKDYADGLNSTMNDRVEALEAIDHDHTNKTVLDGITAEKVTGWDNASAKVHEHSNLSVLEGITSTKVAAWDVAEGNAKTFAQGLNDAMATRVTTLETWHNNFTEVSEDEINALFA